MTSHNHSHNHESAKRAGALAAPTTRGQVVVLIYGADGVHTAYGPLESREDADSFVANFLDRDEADWYDILSLVHPRQTK